MPTKRFMKNAKMKSIVFEIVFSYGVSLLLFVTIAPKIVSSIRQRDCPTV